jgi:hypothetical protein
MASSNAKLSLPQECEAWATLDATNVAAHKTGDVSLDGTFGEVLALTKGDVTSEVASRIRSVVVGVLEAVVPLQKLDIYCTYLLCVDVWLG